MSDSDDKTPPASSAVDEALKSIPGLAASVPSKERPGAIDYLGQPTSGDETDHEVAAGEREKPEDSDAVQAALNQIPGLKDRLGG